MLCSVHWQLISRDPATRTNIAATTTAKYQPQQLQKQQQLGEVKNQGHCRNVHAKGEKRQNKIN